MSNELNKKYGLLTAICTVVGTVIGSGVFFKAEKILTETGGNLPVGILAWIIGGLIMVVCAYAFSILATKHEKVSGIVDYAEALVGKSYGYYIGWFMTMIYYPTMTSVLAWVSARYTLLLFNPSADITGGLCMALGALYLCFFYAINILSPKLAGKFQVGATAVKLVPLVLMAIVGTIVGISNGNTSAAFETWHKVEETGIGSPLFAAVVATAFAYEGWIIATSINAELKNSKKNLPIALVVGSIIIVAVYIFYYIGLAGAAEIPVLMQDGATKGFLNIFGNVTGNDNAQTDFVAVVDTGLGQFQTLLLVQEEHLAGLAHCEDAVAAALHIELHNAAHCVHIHPAALVVRRNHCRINARSD